jgi:hypothetical protein
VPSSVTLVLGLFLVLADFVCDKFAGITPIQGCCNQQISEPMSMPTPASSDMPLRLQFTGIVCLILMIV